MTTQPIGDLTGLSRLLADLQERGLKIEEDFDGSAASRLEVRRGGAGPSDAGMIKVEGIPITVPVSAQYASTSPYRLVAEEDGWGVYEGQVRQASAQAGERPRYYDLTTAEGIPYWQIALLHIDSLASTVIQRCSYWGTTDQCHFCGIELSLQAGRTIPAKRPDQLAEVAAAAKDLDGAVDVTLTTGTTFGGDKGARYLGRCARAIKDKTGLPVEAQFEPPEDLTVLEAIREMGVDSVGIHVESFDPKVLARVAPAKARTGIDGYFAAWSRAVEVFGRGQVSTYVILGMGEDPAVTVEGCRRAADIGVFPFVVPLRPVPGSLMGDLLPPSADYVGTIYQQVAPYLSGRGLLSTSVKAGCARCQACSAMSLLETRVDGEDQAPTPVRLGTRRT